MTFTERRNHARRGEAGRLVLNALLGPSRESDVRDLKAWILAPGATERILKRLGFRGLARTIPGGWEPTPPLLAIIGLQLSDGWE
jgi:hypothetical protein